MNNDERIIYCLHIENQNKLLKLKLRESVKINKKHQELNGKLNLEIEQLKKDKEILFEGNETLGIYRK